MARTTSRRCGAAATCCAIRARARRCQRSRHCAPKDVPNPRFFDETGAAARPRLFYFVGLADGGAARGRGGGRQTINTPVLRHWLQLVADAEDGLGAAEIEMAVRRHLAAETVEDQRLGRLVEIDQDIAAEDDIEAAESGHFVEQVQLPETHHRANRRIDLPALALLLEILDEKLDGQAALHLELRVETGLGLVENLGR